jgi:FkbM family methyltransferase
MHRGAWALIRHVAWRLKASYRRARLRALGREPLWTRVHGGFEMFIDPSDDLDREFYLGTFDRAMLKLISSTVREGDTCIDIGAQKGYVSLTLAQAVGKNGRVLAFDADKRAVSNLAANINRSNQSVIEVFHRALGEREGSCTFVLSKVLGWSSRFPNELAQTAVEMTVEVTVSSFDEMIARKEVSIEPNKVSFIKLDAEGSELLILKGMKSFLSTARPALSVEVNCDSLSAAGSSPQELQELLDELGFDLYEAEYHSYNRKLRLKPAGNLSTMRSSSENCIANIVALPKLIPAGRDGMARLVARRDQRHNEHGGAQRQPVGRRETADETTGSVEL